MTNPLNAAPHPAGCTCEDYVCRFARADAAAPSGPMLTDEEISDIYREQWNADGKAARIAPPVHPLVIQFARAVLARVAAANPWRLAVDDALVTQALRDCTTPDTDPREAVRQLIEGVTQIALDPAVSERAAALAASPKVQAADRTNHANRLRAIKTTLEQANSEGKITDTLWLDSYETLFDALEAECEVAAALAASQPTVQASDSAEQKEAAELIRFLNGEAPLDGVWFGDRHPTEKGAFWWRKRLGALAASPHPASGEPHTLSPEELASELWAMAQGTQPVEEATQAMAARIRAALSAQPKGERIYLVATGQTDEKGRETFTRWEGSPPSMCDYEGPLYASAQPKGEQSTTMEPVAYLRSITHPDWLEVCSADSEGAFPVYATPSAALALLAEAREALDEAMYYTGSAAWSPSMTRDIGDIIARIDALEGGKESAAEGEQK